MSHTLISNKITKILDKKTKKNGGIFFTPINIIKDFFEYDIELFKEYKNIDILEPSCGGCDIIDYITKSDIECSITGIELNKTIYKNIKECYKNVKLINDDFILHKFDKKFDYIPGNPPYFLLSKDDKKKYETFFDKSLMKGKINIFSLFLYKCCELLKDGGVLSYVLPINFLTMKVYNDLRTYIDKNFQILRIKICDDENLFKETKQVTCIFTMRKQKNIDNTQFIFRIKNNIIFMDDLETKTIYDHYDTFSSRQEINISTGRIVWNQIKNKITDAKTNNTSLLIYDFNIVDNKVVIDLEKQNKTKKQYVLDNCDKKFKPPFILVERGRGQQMKKFRHVLVEDNFENEDGYLIENHLYVITGPLLLLKKINSRFSEKSFLKVCENYLKTGSMTKGLLETLPIFKKINPET